MVFEERLSPARVSAAAAAKLPRMVLLALIVAYIVSGLFGRDPWQEDDATGFGVMWTMAHGGQWLLPAVAGERVAADGPLAYWAGAAAIAAAGPLLGDVAAARLPIVLWFFLATAALWYGTLELARRDEAQPVAFAFGGEATRRDYGRMLADVAVLLLLGTIGPVVTLHETTAEPAAFALQCTVIYGVALSPQRPQAGAAIAGVALGLFWLARGAQPGLWLALGGIAAVATAAPAAARGRAAALLVASALGVVAAWMAAVVGVHGETGQAYLADWATESLRRFAWPQVESAAWLLRTLPWHTWPLWPLAAWAVYAWRHGIGRPHIAVGLWLLIAHLFAVLVTPAPSADDLLFVVPPLVLLAAFGAVALRRAAENVIDWFAVTAFCLFSVALWAYFFAMHAGVPPKMSASVLRLTAGFVPPLDAARVAVAAAATAFWIGLVIWRVRQPAAPLWRGPALAATGLVTLWVTFSMLFLSAVDHRRSFAAVARTVASEMAQAGASAADCVLAHQLRPSHLAVFAYHGRIRFGGGDCAFALHRDMAGSLLDDMPPPGQWAQVWAGHRPGLAHEVIRLYRRTSD
jgi:4-amino-4-deoxy-L-arabinose transferase-like glycosyltransferase